VRATCILSEEAHEVSSRRFIFYFAILK